MTAKVLRERHARSFVLFSKYSRGAAWVIFGSYVLQIIAAIATGAWLLSGTVSALEGMGVAALMLFIATRFRGLNNIIHECSHASFSSLREDNTTIGKLCAAMTMNSFVDYRHEHLSHHAHLGNYEKDLDLQGIEHFRLHDPLTPRVVLRHLTTPLLLRHLPDYLSFNLSGKDGHLYLSIKLAILAATLGALVVFPVTTALLVVLPFVVIYSAFNYWADCLDHAGLVPSDDDLEGSRNILAPQPISWLLFPRNDAYHLVHHLFPQIPARHLPEAHEVLLSDDVYRSTPNAVRLPDHKAVQETA